jgi:hypothetical protein
MSILPQAGGHASLRLGRLVAGGALVLCCWALLEAGEVRADSCGHYVKRLGPGFVPGNAADTKAAAEKIPAEAPCGCRGPQCRQLPPQHSPLQPTAPVRFTTHQDVTSTAAATLQLSLDGSWLAGEFSGRPSRGYPQPLGRPPSA